MAGAGGAGRFTLRMPGFSAEPIQFTRLFWNTRRTLRLLWTFVVLAVLVTVTGACCRPADELGSDAHFVCAPQCSPCSYRRAVCGSQRSRSA